MSKSSENAEKCAEMSHDGGGFAGRLRAVRKAARMSAEDFGVRIGVSAAAIILVEAGGGLLPEAALCRLAAAYAVDLHELLTGTPSPKIAVEVAAAEAVKKDLRLFRNAIGEQVKGLKSLDGKIAAALKAADGALKPKVDKTQEANNGNEQGAIKDSAA